MGIYRRFKSRVKRKGLFDTLIYCFQKVLGITKLQEETTALYYFLEQQIEPKDLPRSKNPDLRILQDCDTMLLGIFDRMCHKYSLTYWIEYGTLLGAIRHKGFIPWDDDTDVAMPREDFEKVFDLMHDELESYNITIEYRYNELAGLAMHYRHQDTGIWIDILPMDTFITNLDLNETRLMLYPLIDSYLHYYESHTNEKKHVIWEKKNEYVFSHQDLDGKNKYYFHGREYPEARNRAFKNEDMVPCQRVFFNGVELNAPANPDAFLRYSYGNNYMGFPHSGILHHGEASGRPPLDQWAKLHGVNMKEIYKELSDIYSEI